MCVKYFNFIDLNVGFDMVDVLEWLNLELFSHGFDEFIML